MYIIRILSPGKSPIILTTTNQVFTIGQSYHCDLRIVLPSVGKLHCTINMEERRYEVYGGRDIVLYRRNGLKEHMNTKDDIIIEQTHLNETQNHNNGRVQKQDPSEEKSKEKNEIDDEKKSKEKNEIDVEKKSKEKNKIDAEKNKIDEIAEAVGEKVIKINKDENIRENTGQNIKDKNITSKNPLHFSENPLDDPERNLFLRDTSGPFYSRRGEFHYGDVFDIRGTLLSVEWDGAESLFIVKEDMAVKLTEDLAQTESTVFKKEDIKDISTGQSSMESVLPDKNIDPFAVASRVFSKEHLGENVDKERRPEITEKEDIRSELVQQAMEIVDRRLEERGLVGEKRVVQLIDERIRVVETLYC